MKYFALALATVMLSSTVPAMAAGVSGDADGTAKVFSKMGTTTISISNREAEPGDDGGRRRRGRRSR